MQIPSSVYHHDADDISTHPLIKGFYHSLAFHIWATILQWENWGSSPPGRICVSESMRQTASCFQVESDLAAMWRWRIEEQSPDSDQKLAEQNLSPYREDIFQFAEARPGSKRYHWVYGKVMFIFLTDLKHIDERLWKSTKSELHFREYCGGGLMKGLSGYKVLTSNLEREVLMWVLISESDGNIIQR